MNCVIDVIGKTVAFSDEDGRALTFKHDEVAEAALALSRAADLFGVRAPIIVPSSPAGVMTESELVRRWSR